MATAYAYKAKAKANFKTGYLVRAEVVDASVSADCAVGDVVTIANEGTASAIIAPIVVSYTSASSQQSAYSASVVNAAKASVSAGQLIVAQADQTMEYGHVPVEDRDYRYSPVVKSASTHKKIAVYRIRDISNINKDAEYLGETTVTV